MSDELVKDYAIRKSGYYYRSNWSGYTRDLEHAGRYRKEDAEREASVEPETMDVVPFPADVKPRVICEGCGSYWTGDDLRAAKSRDPKLLSCCPERKPLTIDQWQAKAEALNAENARLREALKDFLGLFDTPIGRRQHSNDEFYAEAVAAARSAIKESEG